MKPSECETPLKQQNTPLVSGSSVFHISMCDFSSQFLSHNSSAMCWDMSSFPTNVDTHIISLNQSKVD